MKIVKAKADHRLWYIIGEKPDPFRLVDVITWIVGPDRPIPVTVSGPVTGSYMLGTKTGWQHWPSGNIFRNSREVYNFLAGQPAP